MDIIIHGKPLSGSSKSTSGIDDALCNKIVDDYFKLLTELGNREIMIVEAKYWKGVWYGVYTYFISSNVKDTAGRDSYLAISIITKNQYYRLVSEVYSHLKNVVKNNVIGTYLSDLKKFQVQNLNDENLFNNLLQSLNGNFISITSEFTPDFKPQNPTFDTICNVVDCDALSFIQLLKSKGVIIVSEDAKTKDSELALVDNYISQSNQYKKDLDKKEKEVNDLRQVVDTKNRDITKLENDSRTEKSNLNNKIRILTSEKEQLLRDLESKRQTREKSTNSHREKEVVIKTVSTKNNVIPILNILLSVSIILMLFFYNQSCECTQYLENKTSSSKTENLSNNSLDNRNVVHNYSSNRDSNAERREEIHSNGLWGDGDGVSSEIESNMDEDCGIVLYLSGIRYNGGKDIDVDFDRNITVSFMSADGRGIEAQDGYKFYVSNVQNREDVLNNLNSGESAIIKVQNKDNPIFISYRTSNTSNKNPNNCFKLVKKDGN